MRGQEFIYHGSAPVEIIFGGSQLIGYSCVGAGVPLSIISGFKSRRILRTRSNRTEGM